MNSASVYVAINLPSCSPRRSSGARRLAFKIEQHLQVHALCVRTLIRKQSVNTAVCTFSYSLCTVHCTHTGNRVAAWIALVVLSVLYVQCVN